VAAGEAAKRRVGEQYQWSNIAAKIESVYFDVLGWQRPATAPRKPSRSAPPPAAEVRRIAG
jgi:hypothetical protein